VNCAIPSSFVLFRDSCSLSDGFCNSTSSLSFDLRVLPSLLLDCFGNQPSPNSHQKCDVFLSPSIWQPDSFTLAASARSPAVVRVMERLVTSVSNASLELFAETSGVHAVTVQLLDSKGAVLLQFVHEFVVFPSFSAREFSQPLVVNTIGSKISLSFDDSVLLAMSMRAEVVCSGGGTTAADFHVPLMAASIDVTVPWRPFKASNNSCNVRVRAIARQFTSLHALSFSATMTEALAAVQQPLQFTVGQLGSFPVYLPPSFNNAESVTCSADDVAHVTCSTRSLDTAALARFVDVVVTCKVVGSAAVTVSMQRASASFAVACLHPLVVDRPVVHVRVTHIASLRASLIQPCTLAIDCPTSWSCSFSDASISIVPPVTADAVTSLVLMSMGPASCMNNATITVYAHPLAVFSQPLLLLPPSPDNRGGLVASGRVFGPISSTSPVLLVFSSAPRLLTFCNLTLDSSRKEFSIVFVRNDISQAALPCEVPLLDASLSTTGCPAASSICTSITMVFPCDECVFAPGTSAPAPSASAVQLTQSVALAAGGSFFVGSVSQLPRQSSIALSLSLVIPSNGPVVVSFTSGPCATITPTSFLFSAAQPVVQMQVYWASAGTCHIAASSPAFSALNFTVINAVPSVVMSPAVVRSNVWQRMVILTLNVPTNLVNGQTRLRLELSSHNETVGSVPSDSVAIDFRCSCARVPFTIRSPGTTRIRSVFVEGPDDVTGLQQVDMSVAYRKLSLCSSLRNDALFADCWRRGRSSPVAAHPN
jgi:hypothetical protein